MSSKTPSLGWLHAAGTPRQIGFALGKQGRAAVHRHLTPAPIWQQVNRPKLADRLAGLTAATKDGFPDVWEEIEGLAAGLELPVSQVMAWNCRGDLLAASPDGCTTVLKPGKNHTVAHNEDGLPFFKGSCFIVEAAPKAAPGFRSFCYPGSLPGHTFAVTERNLIQTINNLRLRNVTLGAPRMVLARAVLGAGTLDQAVSLLNQTPSCGGFHMTLAQSGDPRLISIEFGAGQVSTREITTPSLHANHALHLSGALNHQIITASSRDRQRRGDSLLRQPDSDPRAILNDTGGPGLPIRRDRPDDPDSENTLATITLTVKPTGVVWSIYEEASGAPVYRGGHQPD
tara:strand:- start:601 stop:1629 length:1029 start_codon:yes stop_codon:yes gene_type:complete